MGSSSSPLKMFGHLGLPQIALGHAINGDSLDGSRSDVHILRALPAFPQDRSEVWTATVTLERHARRAYL
jgi:hypothetical protein